MTDLRALLVVGGACVGCATSNGHDWLSSPIDAHTEPHAELMAPATEMEPRPRLSHTVTLGETYVGQGAPAASSDGSPVQVNVHTQVPIVVNNYGYGYGRAVVSRARASRATSAAPIKVGGDFPAPPDYGPRAYK